MTGYQVTSGQLVLKSMCLMYRINASVHTRTRPRARARAHAHTHTHTHRHTYTHTLSLTQNNSTSWDLVTVSLYTLMPK